MRSTLSLTVREKSSIHPSIDWNNQQPSQTHTDPSLTTHPTATTTTVENKKVLNALPAPLTVGTIQLGVGAVYVLLLWLLRLRPVPKLHDTKLVQTVGWWHCLGQLFTEVSLGAGPVSFTHIVKALEPFFSAAVSAILLGQVLPIPVYLSLLPVVGGVAYACLKERSFSWLAFATAMGSNLAFALRAVWSKLAMGSGGTNLSPPNVFGLVTIVAFLFGIPLAWAGEGDVFGGLWQTALEKHSQRTLVQMVLVSGFFHYINNEVMYLALGSVHPVTLAVGNTMKRVFIMVASVMVFRNEISLQAGIGSAVGIGGVLVYSLTKQYYEKLEAEKAAAAAAAAKRSLLAKVIEPENKKRRAFLPKKK